MKILLRFTLLVLFFPMTLLGQNKGNPHFFKLLAFNQNQEILLINFDGSWEIPGSRYDENSTIPKFIDSMAEDHGIKVNGTKLSALVTFHHETRKLPTMMFYYRSNYESGELVTPSWGKDVRWFSLEEAYKVIPYQEMNYIIKSIVSENRLLTGALIIEYDKQTYRRTGSFRIIDPLKKSE